MLLGNVLCGWCSSVFIGFSLGVVECSLCSVPLCVVVCSYGGEYQGVHTHVQLHVVHECYGTTKYRQKQQR